MAKERVTLSRNTGTKENPIWEVWFGKTVYDAVMMSDNEKETKNIKQYVDEKIASLLGGAPETGDTLKELFDLITNNKSLVDALNEAIAKKSSIDHVHDESTTTKSGFMSAGDKSKLNGIEQNANRYIHPDKHPASIITQDANNQFVTATEKTTWSEKANVYFGDSLPASAPVGTLCFLIV